ncbi:MAG: GNAT family N-acetyltransferase [Flavobacteriaceae bacterium]
MPGTEGIASLEEAGYASWPAEQEWRDDGFVIRLSPSLPYKRCSSLNFSLQAPAAPLSALMRARNAFSEAGVAFCVRQTPLTPPPLAALMDREGWPAHGHSHVMTTTLPVEAALAGNDVRATDSFSPEWLDAYLSFSRAVRQRETFAGVLKRIVPPTVYLSIVRDGRIAAVGVMVRDGERAGLFGIAVDPAHKRRGYGECLSRYALRRAARGGARLGWLQVEAANAPAIALYRKIGFTTAYSYCYRTPPSHDAEP